MNNWQSNRFSRCSLAILVTISILNTNNCTPVESRLQSDSKHHLLERELLYLKNQPLSEDLQAFIRRIKFSKERSHTNNKREVEDDDHVIISDDDDICKYTSTTPSSLLCSTSAAVETTTPLKATATSVSATTTTPTTTQTTTTHPTSTTPVSSVTGSVNETEDELEREGPKLEPQLLTKVVDDVQELLKIQQEGIAKGPVSSMCNATGDWDSNAGGMQIRIDATNATYQRPNAQLVDLEPLPGTAGFLSREWSIKADVPFSHCSVILLTAYHSSSKKIAVFIGECRICENEETITGSWMIGRKSRSCKDREESHQFFADVLRKNNVRALQAEHYRLGVAASNTTGII